MAKRYQMYREDIAEYVQSFEFRAQLFRKQNPGKSEWRKFHVNIFYCFLKISGHLINPPVVMLDKVLIGEDDRKSNKEFFYDLP